jgi:hypothetical protein
MLNEPECLRSLQSTVARRLCAADAVNMPRIGTALIRRIIGGGIADRVLVQPKAERRGACEPDSKQLDHKDIAQKGDQRRPEKAAPPSKP